LRRSLGLRRRPLTVTCIAGITGCGAAVEGERDERIVREWIVREYEI
jgi:hypothetical protein